MSNIAHVAAVSINQTVGDWEGNAQRIIKAIAECRSRGVQLICFPEMCIPGYSLGDRLQMEGTLSRSAAMVHQILGYTVGLVVIVGLPIRFRGVLYNVAVVLADGKIAGIVPKENLATGDVQYENRWFSGWPHTRTEQYQLLSGEKVPFGGLIFEAPGLGKFAIEICEDGWKGMRPGSSYVLAGAHIVCNPSASWFVVGKHRVRRSMVEQVSREDHCAYLYTSLMGCDATRLIYDGSVFIAVDGEIKKEGRRFLFSDDFEIVDWLVDCRALERVRIEEGSWRQQTEKLLSGAYGTVPQTVLLEGDFSTERIPFLPHPYWRTKIPKSSDMSLQWLVDLNLIPQFKALDLAHIELELALTMGLREYVKKCGISNLALALSGGRDSTMVALLVARMFRYDNPSLSDSELRAKIGAHFFTAYLGTEHSGESTRSAAQELSKAIGATHYETSIQKALDTHLELMEDLTGVALKWNNKQHDIPLQNVQARLRGSLIWMVANVHNALLLSTSNKSEAAVGYTTMDGDTSGGLSPIADVPKSLVTEWLEWAALFHSIPSVSSVLSTPATAELRPKEEKQTDEDDLMPFFILDQLMHQFVQLGKEPIEMFKSMWPSLTEHYLGDPRAFGAHINKFVRLICFAQWKRERFAISFRVTAFDLDPKTGFRFPPVQAPFKEELLELNSYIEQLCKDKP
ncbi:MAG: NAD(+) synthase [Proteobacteria bacterium]|nr:NAD(+) synthase [Pseudomonadota bacterium]